MSVKIKSVLIFLLFFISTCARGQGLGNQLNLIPKPDSVVYYEGSFEIDENTKIYIDNNLELKNANLLNLFFKDYKGYELNIYFDTIPHTGKIIYLAENKIQELKHESYNFKSSISELLISSPDTSGVFYGIQTLMQILVTNHTLTVPCIEIFDSPRFIWRGMHLDVCRHFFTKDFIKLYIDFIAMYKMNTFHWHLTDDQGWRIEIKKYPKLTEVGAWRKATLIGHYRQYPHIYDSTIYGGYYTQEDIKEIIKYASDRNITIVPEIEMPGHSLAALASYPELSCTGGPFNVEADWGVFEDVFCPTEETFTFLENVLSEVIDLFPGKYIHIGGDEVPKVRWKESKYCQDLIKREGLKDENGLQSYFVKRIEKFVNSKGKILIGWDEILEGGLAPNAVVMSWRGTQGGIDAAKLGHDVVMSPGGYCYFDHYQGDPRSEPLAIGGYTPIEKVYSYEPVPSELKPDEQMHILGAQANVWTEYIPNTKQVEYMVFPRIAALAEVLWSPVKNKDYNNFKKRLFNQFEYLNYFGINYSKAIYDLKMELSPSMTGEGLFIKLFSEFSDKKIGKIYYTTDGNIPNSGSLFYDSLIYLHRNTMVKAAYFEYEQQMGNMLEQQFYVNKATGKEITLLTEPEKKYNTGGAFTLIDGIRGRIPWYGKEWLGFLGKDMEAVIDLGTIQYITAVSVGVLNEPFSWIHLPTSIEVYLSIDGVNYTRLKKVDGDEINRQGRQIEINFGDNKAQFVKIRAVNSGKIPSGFPGAGKDSWLFVDEISVE